ncbi:MAG: hypothetical protein PG981_000670 [Wolbachia endosymbiont of Ctenocephalides orientis wCori]|nr:MAG: hypothetical protein PG981_000670 [Wolbachia endosymbiont of Ctenocephalides orientis wCori]
MLLIDSSTRPFCDKKFLEGAATTTSEKFVERMLSIFLTARLDNQNPVQKLQNLVAISA